MDTGRLFTAKQIAKAAKEALENWDFDVEVLYNDESPEFIKAQKEALNFNEEYAQMWCTDGPMDLDSAYKDIWDFLYEFSINMAGQA